MQISTFRKILSISLKYLAIIFIAYISIYTVLTFNGSYADRLIYSRSHAEHEELGGRHPIIREWHIYGTYEEMSNHVIDGKIKTEWRSLISVNSSISTGTIINIIFCIPSSIEKRIFRSVEDIGMWIG